MRLSVDTSEEKQTDPDSAVMVFFWLFFEAVSVCGSCTLAAFSGLWAVVCSVCVSSVSVFFSFLFSPLIPLISLTVASLQGVAQDFMLSCNHCLTLSLLSVIFLSC